jgi:hypothetical protein
LNIEFGEEPDMIDRDVRELFSVGKGQQKEWVEAF